MRPVTRNVVVALLVTVAGLLALGAVPSLVRSGAPYHVTASPAPDTGEQSAVNVSTLPERRYPYVTGAVANATDATRTNATGRSEPYWRGPLGVKGAFTHSPFDEFDALRQQYPNATDSDAVYLRTNATTYRAAIAREAG